MYLYGSCLTILKSDWSRITIKLLAEHWLKLFIKVCFVSWKVIVGPTAAKSRAAAACGAESHTRVSAGAGEINKDTSPGWEKGCSKEPKAPIKCGEMSIIV